MPCTASPTATYDRSWGLPLIPSHQTKTGNRARSLGCSVVSDAHGLIAKIPRSRRWRVSLAGRRTMSTAIKLREVAYPALFASAA